MKNENIVKKIIRKSIVVILSPINKIKVRNQNRKKFNSEFELIKQNSVLAVFRIGWLGTSFSTKELFKNCVGLSEIYNDTEYYARKFAEKNLKLIIFSAFDLSWKDLVIRINNLNPNTKIKVLWHGSNAMNVENYDYDSLKTVLDFCKNGNISSVGFVKKSMYEFYNKKGFNCEFVMNTLSIDKSKYNAKQKENKYVRIGIYASADRWVKNFYNQLSAASMIENHLIDCVPVSKKMIDFAKIIDANLVGEVNSLPREELLDRISNNDINVYVTFVECAPLLPLESFELGVPCITSNNHHYWEGTGLEKYLIVSSPDNIIEIKKKIEYVLDNKEKIMHLYDIWKKNYDKQAKKTVNDFIKK